MGVTARTGPFNAAAEVFGVDDNITNKFPRLKYNFNVQFILNENVPSPGVPNKNFVFNRVVSAGLPDTDYGITSLNQYNRLRYIPTRLTVGTVPIVFYDTKDNLFQNIMLAYAGHYFHGHNINPLNFNGYEVVSEQFGPPSGGSSIFGAKTISKSSRFFFEQININSRESAGGGRSIQLFNCMINSIQHDTLAYSDSQPVQYSVVFQPEHYNITAEAGSSNQGFVDQSNILNTQNQQSANTPQQSAQPTQSFTAYTGTKKVDENIVERNGELFKVAPDPAGPQ